MTIENRKTYVMQRIQRAIGSNTINRYAVFEFETKTETDRFLLKSDKAYEANISASSKSKRRKSGLATTTAYAYERPESPNKKQKKFWVILLVSDGAGLVERETLHDIKQQRVSLDGYELVHDGATWSWQMTAATTKYWEDRIRRVCAARPEKRSLVIAQSLVNSIENAPKFRIVRKQIGNLFSLYRKEWQRLRPANDPMPTFPTFLPFVRQLPKSPEKQQKTVKKEEKSTETEHLLASPQNANRLKKSIKQYKRLEQESDPWDYDPLSSISPFAQE